MQTLLWFLCGGMCPPSRFTVAESVINQSCILILGESSYAVNFKIRQIKGDTRKGQDNVWVECIEEISDDIGNDRFTLLLTKTLHRQIISI